ncbi:NADH-quinone oxidoreductase subunit NuoF, partial [bacterium]|nr:NADH-quinone oxidoreductase subunit NuoF [bacterium]
MTIMRIGLGTCGVSAGANDILNKMEELVSAKKINVKIVKTGCIGMCYREVLVEIESEDGKKFLYGNVKPENCSQIVEQHLISGEPVQELLISLDADESIKAYWNKQDRIVLRNCGIIDPDSIEDYISRDGYNGLKKVLSEMSADEVIKEVKDSGLRGRGGGGFSTGMKWGFAKNAPNSPKFIICNADEGDPGAFMDRSILEGDPHSILEGMIIAGFAIGASSGHIYVRAEYPMAVQRLKRCIEQCHEKGILGKNIFDSEFEFDIRVKEGAGAFVCGEETALIASLEGKRGIPRIRPPFPAIKGFKGLPTNINNVETFANIPWIITNGASKYAAYGTEKSKGTKVFALAGKIKRSGLVEVPMGMTINEVIHEVGGGIKNNGTFKAVQMGGPSGGCIPASMGDIKIDYDEITKTGAIMGSGGLIVMDESTCMVDIAKFFLTFTQNESCGKCTFCRIGTKRMLECLERITEGKGKIEDLDELNDLAEQIKNSSLCGLGQTAPNPVLTTIKYFRKEYEAHIIDLPGAYSLTEYTIEEKVTKSFLQSDEYDVIVNVVDSTNLQRNLLFTT